MLASHVRLVGSGLAHPPLDMQRCCNHGCLLCPDPYKHCGQQYLPPTGWSTCRSHLRMPQLLGFATYGTGALFWIFPRLSPGAVARLRCARRATSPRFVTAEAHKHNGQTRAPIGAAEVWRRILHLCMIVDGKHCQKYVSLGALP